MSKFWKVEDSTVAEAFLAFEFITLAAMLLGPHDYHAVKNTDGTYSQSTGSRLTSFHKIALLWKTKHKLVDVVVEATRAHKSPREIASLVSSIVKEAWPKGSLLSGSGAAGMHGTLTFDRWRLAWDGFIEHPVAPAMGPNAATVAFVDALDDAAAGNVGAATTTLTDDIAQAYEYEGGCEKCELHPGGYTPPRFPMQPTDETGTRRKLEPMEFKPRMLTSDVCKHFVLLMCLMEGAKTGT